MPVDLKDQLRVIADDDERTISYIAKKFLEKCVHAWHAQKAHEVEMYAREKERRGNSPF